MKIIQIIGLILFSSTGSICQNLSFTEVRDSIQSIMLKDDIPGLSIAIINKSDSLYWAGGFGFGDIENAKPMTAHTTMYIASVSKNFLAMAMMILVERGQVRLSDNISSIIPEVNIKNMWSDASPITVEMVLEHTTGFDDIRFNNFIAPDSEYLPLLEILNKYPNALESRWQPGTLFSYSNLNYTVAGYIIEKVSGRRFEDFVQDEILNPLKMSETRVRDFTQKTDSISIPYVYNFDT
ncbi:MAG: serine hydrolase domain-containing protein [Fulvivirga sp.]|uniref:serine hydrolase domain-containing protein n=1 Tax=Fulvivirga sp. TaxID=1931237 RepID=UPI0032EDA5DB